MRKSAAARLAALFISALALSACGHSDKAGDAASPDNVEMPAEEAMSAVPAGVGPVGDASGAASDTAANAADVAASAAQAASGTPAN